LGGGGGGIRRGGTRAGKRESVPLPAAGLAGHAFISWRWSQEVDKEEEEEKEKEEEEGFWPHLP